MRRLTATALLLTLLITGLQGGVQRAGAQTPLSATAQILAAFANPGSVTEISNEAFVRASPDYAAPTTKYGRLTGIIQFLRSPNARQNDTTLEIVLFKDADAAWGFAQEYPLSFTVEIDHELPSPGMGERSRAILISSRFGGLGAPRYLFFQRDRVFVRVTSPDNTEAAAFAANVARDVDNRIAGQPPGPLTPEQAALAEAPTPTVLVRGAVRTLLTTFVDVLDPGQLFGEAWQGAATALRRAGVTDVPAAPSFPSDESAAVALHMQSFPTLERLAEGRLSGQALADAAIQELARRRADCHTVYLSAEAWQRQRAAQVGEAQPPSFGINLSNGLPLTITRVAPGSPAQAVGVRRGQEIVAINGRAIAGLTVSQSVALLDRRENATNAFVLRNPSGSTIEVSFPVARFRTPPMESFVTPEGMGVLRFYSFEFGNEQVSLMRAALEEFEAQGVTGWVMDLRENGGGSLVTRTNIASLFVQSGRLFASVSRNQPPVWTEATGAVLPFQRPLVILTGPITASSSEMVTGALQARGRAIVVGQRSAGCVGTTVDTGLLDGSDLRPTTSETIVGPDGLHLHRVGITPNVEVAPPTAADIEAGYDPQLAAAVDVLQEIAGTPVAPYRNDERSVMSDEPELSRR